MAEQKGTDLEGRLRPYVAAEMTKCLGIVVVMSERIKISDSPGKLQLPHLLCPDPMPMVPRPGDLFHNGISGLNPLVNQSTPGSAILEKRP